MASLLIISITFIRAKKNKKNPEKNKKQVIKKVEKIDKCSEWQSHSIHTHANALLNFRIIIAQNRIGIIGVLPELNSPPQCAIFIFAKICDQKHNFTFSHLLHAHIFCYRLLPATGKPIQFLRKTRTPQRTQQPNTTKKLETGVPARILLQLLPKGTRSRTFN